MKDCILAREVWILIELTRGSWPVTLFVQVCLHNQIVRWRSLVASMARDAAFCLRIATRVQTNPWWVIITLYTSWKNLNNVGSTVKTLAHYWTIWGMCHQVKGIITAHVESCATLFHSYRSNIVGSLCDREVACSAIYRQSSNFKSCVWSSVSFFIHSSFHSCIYVFVRSFVRSLVLSCVH